MDTWYWALEYVRVFFAYVMILFVWPSVVFRDYLRGIQEEEEDCSWHSC